MKRTIAISICLCLVPAGLLLAGDVKSKSPTERLDISVQDMTGLKSLRPVTGGVPLTEGAAPEGMRRCSSH